MDIIFIKELKVQAIIGIYDFERKNEQPVIINIAMAKDLDEAATSEDLAKTINYQDVAEKTKSLVIEGKFLLVETMAEKIASMILAQFETPWVSIEVSKPNALQDANFVGVKIERGKISSVSK